MKITLSESPEELNRKIHLKAYAPIKDRLRSVLLASQRKSAQEIAKMLGYARSTVERWVERYRNHGEAGLWDRPRPGQPKRLTPEQEQEVKEWIDTGPKKEEGRSYYRVDDLQRKIEETMGVKFSRSGVGYLVRVRFGYRLLRPRPVHPKNDKTAMEKWEADAPFLSSR